MDSEEVKGADPVQDKLVELKVLIEKQVGEVSSLKDVVLSISTKLDKMETK